MGPEKGKQRCGPGGIPPKPVRGDLLKLKKKKMRWGGNKRGRANESLPGNSKVSFLATEMQ